MLNDDEALRILYMFQGILNVQQEQGIDSFEGVEKETINAIDTIIKARYSGNNKVISNGFVSITSWFEGVELIKQKIKQLDN